MSDMYNPRLSVLQPRVDRLQHILELIRAAMRDDLIPGSALAPIISHVIDEMMALPKEPI